MIILNFYLKSIAVPPFKTDPPLSIDTDAAQSTEITTQTFQMIPRGIAHVFYIDCRIKLFQLPISSPLKINELAHSAACKESKPST